MQNGLPFVYDGIRDYYFVGANKGKLEIERNNAGVIGQMVLTQ
jgi:hypothetical protein